MKSYKNFESAISYFDPAMMLSHEDALGAIEMSIKTGYIDKIILLLEVEEAFENPYFNWVQFVLQNKVLYDNDKQNLTNYDAKEYIKSLIWDYLFSD